MITDFSLTLDFFKERYQIIYHTLNYIILDIIDEMSFSCVYSWVKVSVSLLLISAKRFYCRIPKI